MRSRSDKALAALEKTMFQAQRTGLPHIVAWAVPGGGAARFYGTTPLTEVLTWLDQREAQFGHDWRLTDWRAPALALLGRFEEARALQTQFRQSLEERGDLLTLGGNLSQNSASLELVAGDPAAAAALAERGCRILEEAGERAWLSTGACFYAEALYGLGRLEEAEEWARKGSELGYTEDTTTQMLARQVQAKVLACRGQHAEAERLAREAVALADTTDGLLFQGDARRELAEVFELAEQREEAAAALRDALERYERKGALVPADRVRERLAVLEAPATA
jgi:tetratricopeptide (TPR) repeat protein